MAKQLSFELPIRQALGREDFFVSPSNAAAVGLIESYQSWPSRKLLLIGPEGSGKTHLAHVWSKLSGATIIKAADLTKDHVPDLASAPTVIEDCHEISGKSDQEEALFHLHNLALAEGQPLLFTGQSEPMYWQLGLPDLASRLSGTPAISLGPPDDNLLAAILMKLMSDRQLMPSPETIPYLVKRMERSFSAARRIVEDLDSRSLSERKPITRTLAAKVLGL